MGSNNRDVNTRSDTAAEDAEIERLANEYLNLRNGGNQNA